MDHLAIMHASWGLLPKIILGKKTIESRWYKSRYAPWGKINKGDRVFFKNSGKPVTVMALVTKVIEFSDLTPLEVKKILRRYGDRDGIDAGTIATYYQMFKNKKYCILVFLSNARLVEPFEINKRGYGSMAAWITVKNIRQLEK